MIRKTCDICQRIYDARTTQRTCSYACAAQRKSRRMTGKTWSPAKRASAKARRKAEIESIVEGKFGAMTTREIAIFNEGARVGYYRGWYRAWSTYQKPEAA